MPANQETKELLKDLRVLCVDDEEWVRDSFAEFLKRRFKEVFTAADGKEGLEAYKEKQPDIIITDVMMPRMSGLEMSREIKKIDSDMPIVVVSAFNDTSLLLEAIESGIDSYVTKPINNDMLFEALRKNALRIKFRSAQRELQSQERFLQTIAENSPAGICMCKEGIIFVNDAMSAITGYSKDELLKMNFWQDFLMMEGDPKELFARQIEENRFIKHSETHINTKEGDVKYVDIAANIIEDDGGHVCIANILDVSKRKYFENELEQSKIMLQELNSELKENILIIEEKNQQLENQLYSDKLTSLPNRLKLIEDIKNSINPMVILVNIDSFKEVNDFYGSDAGDYVINAVARKLLDIIQNTHYKLYKMQADEYALYTEDKSSTNRIEEFVKELHDEMEKHVIFIKEQEVHIGITAGIAKERKDSVLAKADIALKRAKKNRKPYLIYDDSMMVMKEYEDNFKWMNLLKNALDNERIVAFFQPIMDNSTHEIAKFECLARLISKEENVYSPFFFIDISKRSRLYKRITKAMISDSFEKFKDTEYTFSINLSIDDIFDRGTLNFIIEQLDRYNIAKRVTFEILESEGIDNYEDVANFISKVKALGCKVAIDDFGSGYSNFAHILKLNIDYIKIDASIIRNVDEDKNSQIITKTIVKFSKQLNIKTVAEFVHSSEVFDTVKEYGVDYSQGYYIAKPSKELNTTPNFS